MFENQVDSVIRSAVWVGCGSLSSPHDLPWWAGACQPKDVRYAAVTAYPADSPPYLIENRTAFRLLVGQSRVGPRRPPLETVSQLFPSPLKFEFLCCLVFELICGVSIKLLLSHPLHRPKFLLCWLDSFPC